MKNGQFQLIFGGVQKYLSTINGNPAGTLGPGFVCEIVSDGTTWYPGATASASGLDKAVSCMKYWTYQHGGTPIIAGDVI